MKKTSIAALAATLLFAASCKDDDVQPGTNTYPDYSQLKTGNYWVYEIFDIDSTGNGSSMGYTDSCYINKDTVINGNTYYFLNDPAFLYSSTIGNRWLRDSADCIVDPAGRIYFSSMNFTTPFASYIYPGFDNDTMTIVTEQMTAPNAGFVAPAGTFITSDSRITYHTLPPYDPSSAYRYLHRRFSQDIGLVSEMLPFYVNSINYTEKRLLRYHVN